MSRSYKTISLKKHRVYSVEQLMAAYSVTANTVSNWVGEGLRPSENRRPYLFQGAVVRDFHRRQHLKMCSKLLPGQFKCRKCQSNVFPRIKTVADHVDENNRHWYIAQCPHCQGKIQKISAETDRDKIKDCRNPNTPTDCLHEENALERGDIWMSEVKDEPSVHFRNDRIIHRWQTYAGRYSEKTIVAHLSAIRFFEHCLNGKPFMELSSDDFAAVRDELKKRSNVGAVDNLSASSIRHMVSQITLFFDWLVQQDGYRRLPKDFAGYLKMPKAVLARSAQVKQKEFPSLVEAEELLTAMPSKSLVDQRARAIFALAFLGALRADTLVSLQIKHFDKNRRLILQDASVVRAKAGKSLDVFWFPIPVSFETTVIEWIDTLRRFGFAENNALFPDTRYLKLRIGVGGRKAETVPVMSTTHAVTEAFAVACQNCNIKYTPHAAKHTIGAERDNRALRGQDRILSSHWQCKRRNLTVSPFFRFSAVLRMSAQ